MDNLIPVNILIGDKTYRLKIKSSDEEKIRKTVKLINEKIIEYKTSFAGRHMQDYISMVLLWFVTEYQQLGVPEYQSAEIANKIDDLKKIINIAINH